MAKKLYDLGHWASRRRLLVVLVWVLTLVGAVLAAGAVDSQTDAEVTIPGLESTVASQVLADEFGSASDDDARVVVEVPEGETLTDPANRETVDDLRARLSALPGVVGVTDPLDTASPTVSSDGRAAYLLVDHAGDPDALATEDREAFLDVIEDSSSDTLTVAASGPVTEVEADGLAELLGILFALALLTLTLRSFVLAGMNILAALLGVGISILGITIVSSLVDLTSATSAVALMLGLAVGIDYSLFIITRFRHELMTGRAVGDAIGTATATAGSAVVTAGVTVIIALAGLSLVGITFLTQMGLAAAGAVVVAVLAAVTLMPALLGFVGTRALSRRRRARLADGSTAPLPEARGIFSAWGRAVTTGRWPALVGGVVALAAVALPALSLRTTLLETPQAGTTQATAQAIIDDRFGEGLDGSLVVLVEGDDPLPLGEQIAAEAAGLEDVALVAPPVASADGTAAMVTIVPESGPTSPETEELVTDVRERFQGDDSHRVSVTGLTAVSIDVTAKIAAALPVYVGAVVVLALALLVLVFRSILVPVIALAGFLLTLGASFGATTAVFQRGWFADLVGATVGPINSVAPIIVVGVLFGLAMDYQVFIVSRIYEARAQGLDARAAVATGIRGVGPVVLTAGAVMLAVFISFIPTGDGTVKPIAFTLAVGILVDALVVRMLVVPALLSILGDRAWQLPRRLRRLPRLDVDGEHLTSTERTPVARR